MASTQPKGGRVFDPPPPGQYGPRAPVDHRTLQGFEHLIPVSGRAIVVTPYSIDSEIVAAQIRRQGGAVTHFDTSQIPRYYPKSAQGLPRRQDNADLLPSTNVYWEGVDDLRADYEEAQALGAEHQRACEQFSPLVGKAEQPGVEKLTIQTRPQFYPGHVIETLINDSGLSTLSEEWYYAADRLARFLARRAGPWLKATLLECLAEDGSPIDTNVGLPTLASGEDGMAMRIQTAMAIPRVDPEGSAVRFLQEYDRFARSVWGLPEGVIHDSTTSKRTGPSIKNAVLWVIEAHRAYATWQATGAYERARLVYMVSAIHNAIETLVAIPLKKAIAGFPGLDHSPEVAEQAVRQMQENGGEPYEADWSQMDRTLGPAHKVGMWTALRQAGFNRFACDMLIALEHMQGVLYPSWFAEGGATRATGPHGLMSGHRVTSITDTFCNLAAILSGLADQLGPEVYDRFEAGTLGLRVLGDDTAFALPGAWDRRFRAERLTQWVGEHGGSLELGPGIVFLQKMQALGPLRNNHPGLHIGLGGRALQQTLFNENPATETYLARLGFTVRMAHLQGHPNEAAFRKGIEALVAKRLRFARGPEGPYLRPGDPALIAAYVAKRTGYVTGMLAREEYQPSVRDTIAMLASSGVDIRTLAAEELSFAAAIRQRVGEALLSAPDPRAGSVVRQYIRAKGGG